MLLNNDPTITDPINKNCIIDEGERLKKLNERSSVKELEHQFKNTNINSENCYNCEYCYSCVNCENCSHCKLCTNCYNCVNCENCSDIYDIQNIKNYNHKSFN